MLQPKKTAAARPANKAGNKTSIPKPINNVSTYSNKWSDIASQKKEQKYGIKWNQRYKQVNENKEKTNEKSNEEKKKEDKSKEYNKCDKEERKNNEQKCRVTDVPQTGRSQKEIIELYKNWKQTQPNTSNSESLTCNICTQTDKMMDDKEVFHIYAGDLARSSASPPTSHNSLPNGPVYNYNLKGTYNQQVLYDSSDESSIKINTNKVPQPVPKYNRGAKVNGKSYATRGTQTENILPMHTGAKKKELQISKSVEEFKGAQSLNLQRKLNKDIKMPNLNDCNGSRYAPQQQHIALFHEHVKHLVQNVNDIFNLIRNTDLDPKVIITDDNILPLHNSNLKHFVDLMHKFYPESVEQINYNKLSKLLECIKSYSSENITKDNAENKSLRKEKPKLKTRIPKPYIKNLGKPEQKPNYLPECKKNINNQNRLTKDYVPEYKRKNLSVQGKLPKVKEGQKKNINEQNRLPKDNDPECKRNNLNVQDRLPKENVHDCERKHLNEEYRLQKDYEPECRRNNLCVHDRLPKDYVQVCERKNINEQYRLQNDYEPTYERNNLRVHDRSPKENVHVCERKHINEQYRLPKDYEPEYERNNLSVHDRSPRDYVQECERTNVNEQYQLPKYYEPECKRNNLSVHDRLPKDEQYCERKYINEKYRLPKDYVPEYKITKPYEQVRKSTDCIPECKITKSNEQVRELKDYVPKSKTSNSSEQVRESKFSVPGCKIINVKDLKWDSIIFNRSVNSGRKHLIRTELRKFLINYNYLINNLTSNNQELESISSCDIEIEREMERAQMEKYRRRMYNLNMSYFKSETTLKLVSRPQSNWMNKHYVPITSKHALKRSKRIYNKKTNLHKAGTVSNEKDGKRK